jgi:hypothetical protein
VIEIKSEQASTPSTQRAWKGRRETLQRLSAGVGHMMSLQALTSVRLEVEQIQLVGKYGGFFLGALIVEGPQNGRFLEKGDAENL